MNEPKERRKVEVDGIEEIVRLIEISNLKLELLAKTGGTIETIGLLIGAQKYYIEHLTSYLGLDMSNLRTENDHVVNNAEANS